MRPRQLLYRPRRVLPLRLLAARTHDADPPQWRPLAGGLAVDLAPQSGAVPSPETKGDFHAVGCRRSFHSGAGFWRSGDDGLLFAFHLHGFDALARYASGERRHEHDAFWARVIESWLETQRRPTLPAWHPYPMSGRIAAWCSALSAGGWPEDLRDRMLRSLVRQSDVLRRSIEHDIGGNHVLRNAVGLIFAGVCLGNPRLEQRATALLRRELAAQILADGGHEERSTAYHRAVLADLDGVAQLLRRAAGTVPPWLESARSRMSSWDDQMRGPDGTLPLLNDGWVGPARPRTVGPALTVLPSSGYVVLRHGEHQAILDVAPMAPRHLPAHAHADVLSFVLWGEGSPLIVDPGTFTYSGPDRDRFRATAAHNTLEIDGIDQCELWGNFRAAFLPSVECVEIDQQDSVTVVTARHNGYRRLADPVTHERRFCWLPDTGLVVIDTLHAARAHSARSRLHLAPGIRVQRSFALGPFLVRALGAGPEPLVIAGEYAPHFGVRRPISVIERVLEARPLVPFGWALLRQGAHAILEDRRLTVTLLSGRSVVVELR